MPKSRYDVIEELTDANGVRRKYGYKSGGAVVLINLQEVLAEYRRRGLEGMREVA